MTPGVSERREAALARVSIDSAPRRLRETLERLDEGLVDVELGTRRRVRIIVSEIVGHSTEDDEIRLEVVVLSETIRIELDGRGLALPDHPSFQHDESNGSFPSWLLTELADHWEVDRRRPGIWLLVGRV